MKAQRGEGMLDFHPYFDIQQNFDGKSCQLYALATLYHQGNSSVLICVWVWMDPRATKFGQKE